VGSVMRRMLRGILMDDDDVMRLRQRVSMDREGLYRCGQVLQH